MCALFWSQLWAGEAGVMVFRGTHCCRLDFLSGLAWEPLPYEASQQMLHSGSCPLLPQRPSAAGEGRAYFQELCLPALVGIRKGEAI